MNIENPDRQMLKIGEVESMTKLSRYLINQYTREGTFPKPFRVGRQNRWLAREVDEWLIKGTTPEMMKKADSEGLRDSKTLKKRLNGYITAIGRVFAGLIRSSRIFIRR